MTNQRRDFLKNLCTFGTLQGLAVSPSAARSFSEIITGGAIQETNPDLDPAAYSFWTSFLDERKAPPPIVSAEGQTQRSGVATDSEAQPVFLHYGPDGFTNAAELNASSLIAEGDVSVSLNTSTIKVSQRDQDQFDHLQNAQLRVDVAQKTPILPIIEAMGYTVVSGMLLVKEPAKSTSSFGRVQAVSVQSDTAWQKMQNIILPGGEGRWALNLEAQRKDSLLCKVLQRIVRNVGQFIPLVSMPGVALSALQSFNVLYGAMHARPVAVIKSNPLRVFATQEAVQKTGAPGAATGILLKSGTYVLVPANQAQDLGQLKDLTVIQGRLVPPKTPLNQLDSVAAETLKQMTYVTFDIEAKPARLFSGATAAPQKPALRARG